MIRLLMSFSAILLASLSIFASGAPTAAKESASCEGLDAYFDEVASAAESFIAANESAGIVAGSNPLAYTSDNWSTISENANFWQFQLLLIQPPPSAEDFHQSQIQLAGLIAQISEDVSLRGPVALLDYWEPILGIGIFNVVGLVTAAADCAGSTEAESAVESVLGEEDSGALPALEIPEGVVTYDYVGFRHSAGPVNYTESPPVGGLHDLN